jgi:ABC-type microcin C transport system permease subunit YejB
VSGAPAEKISAFFAGGMLMNVLVSFDAMAEDWGVRLVEACKNNL